MGTPNNAIIAVALARADYRNSEWASYIDDTWRITPPAHGEPRIPVGSDAAVA